MIELKANIHKRFGNLQQIFKSQTNGLVIYRVTNGKSKPWFELFKYKVKQPNKFMQEEYEAYPSDEDFGTWAWSVSSPKSLERVLTNHFPTINQEEIFNILWGVATNHST